MTIIGRYGLLTKIFLAKTSGQRVNQLELFKSNGTQLRTARIQLGLDFAFIG